MAEAKRATRVEEQEFTIGACPVCKESIVGTLTVAVQLGALKVKVTDGQTSDSPKASASVAVSASLRSFQVKHQCDPETVKRLSSGELPSVTE